MLNNTKTQSRPKLLFLVPAISQTHKSLENSQDFFCQDQDQDFIFCPGGASRPRLWSRGLHHWCVHMPGEVDSFNANVDKVLTAAATCQI